MMMNLQILDPKNFPVEEAKLQVDLNKYKEFPEGVIQ